MFHEKGSKNYHYRFMKVFVTLFLSFFISFFSPFTLSAQQKQPPRQSLYAEIGGASLSIISLNYDHALTRNWQGRIGIGFSFDFSEETFLSRISNDEVRNRDFGISLPLTASYLIGNDKKFLELGGGITPLFFSEKNDLTERQNQFYILPTAFIGYRRHPLNSGFVFRVNLVVTYFDQRFSPGLGLSFGFVP